MKWGLLGGTFDPIHIGHLRCAEEVLEIFDLNRVIFVPAARPPHKIDGEITPFYHREQMVRLAIENNPSFSFSDVEKVRGGVSYSVETVEYILQRYMKNLELYFICGQDAFHAIQTWKDWRRLLLLCHFVVMTRPGYENRGLEAILPADFTRDFSYSPEKDGFLGPTGYYIFFREVTFLDIASGRIRKRVEEGKSITYLTPDPVRHYIINNGLYKKG
ncbi:MAG TPA: nicotinate-nucleotide adenylyltransferase [Syntrophales bacterium]|nr:nicotinate-nucleotide adenylyltransferase [Syntrophales bacterium]HOM07110.1 nicotinate-nucleotide adenylyltransferase [Syntrophales bacterium]HOO00375.1 nicotinate-nucleotide adenylyltransferase [Syntrophales bacterium]HPC00446.1 nicotinate-nucleotide adenylyltransferase [Syntrophales bacterium]HPQ05529.1 nicotinate-nucleotide adenylyltransferase [Syntrophales bacterium]